MKIIYENDEGGVSVILPVINKKIGMTVEQIAEKDVPAGTPYEIVEDDVIPTDRYYRDAWKKVGSSIIEDLEGAKIIHMDRIRAVRNKELDKTDLEVTREMENNGSVGIALKAKRQALRNIPQDFKLDSATTTEELKGMWPVELPRPGI